VAGPLTWNSLADSLRDPEPSLDTFKRHFCKCEILMTKCIKCIRDLFEYALYKFTLYLLTYLLEKAVSGQHGSREKGSQCKGCILTLFSKQSKIFSY